MIVKLLENCFSTLYLNIYINQILEEKNTPDFMLPERFVAYFDISMEYEFQDTKTS